MNMTNSSFYNVTEPSSHAFPGGFSGDFSGDSSADGSGSGDFSGDFSGDGPEHMLNSNHYYPLIFPAILIVFANCFIVLLVWGNAKLHRNCNALLVSLAVADGATGLIGIPLLLLAALGDFGEDTFCYINLSTYTWFSFMSVCSIFHLLLIALEQYLAILKPFNHAKIVTKTSVTLTLAVIWTVSIGHAFIPWTWILPLGDAFCEVEDDEVQRREEIFTITSATIFFLLPVSIIIYVYFRIVMEAKSHICRIKKDFVASRDERPVLSPFIRFRGFYIIALMWLVFIVCWSPYFVTVFLVTMKNHELPFWLDYLFTVLRFLPSLLNPLIFMFWKSDLRAACVELCCRSGTKHREHHASVSFAKQQVTLLNRLSDSARQSV